MNFFKWKDNVGSLRTTLLDVQRVKGDELMRVSEKSSISSTSDGKKGGLQAVSYSRGFFLTLCWYTHVQHAIANQCVNNELYYWFIAISTQMQVYDCYILDILAPYRLPQLSLPYVM